MRLRSRILLAIAGGALLLLSCAAIAYAFRPLDSVREQVDLLANLFRLP
jgi:hypothetical protein